MPGIFDWVDPARGALARALRDNPVSQFSELLSNEGPVGVKNAIIEALMSAPKPFQNTDEGNQGALDSALNFGPAALGTVSKNSLAKIAKAMEKESFSTGAPARAVGFHGSPSPDVSFDLSKPAFLSSRADVANDYAAARGLWRSVPKEGATVYPANVEFKNPLVIDAMGKRHDNIPVPWQEWKPKVFGALPKDALSVSQLAEIAKARGHDGLIVKNVIDTADIDGKLKSTVYAALAPDSIKGFFSK